MRAGKDEGLPDERAALSKRSGVVKVAFDPKGLPISHPPPEGDFVRRLTGRGREAGCQGSAIYIYIYIY